MEEIIQLLKSDNIEDIVLGCRIAAETLTINEFRHCRNQAFTIRREFEPTCLLFNDITVVFRRGVGIIAGDHSKGWKNIKDFR